MVCLEVDPPYDVQEPVLLRLTMARCAHTLKRSTQLAARMADERPDRDAIGMMKLEVKLNLHRRNAVDAAGTCSLIGFTHPC